MTFYILIAFLLAYGVETTDFNRDDLLMAVLIGSAIMVPTQFYFSAYSDRNGRKGVFMAGAALTALWAFAIFPLMASGSFILAVIAIAVGLTFLGMMYGPQAAFFAGIIFHRSKILRRFFRVSIGSNNRRFLCTHNCNLALEKL